MAKLIDGKGFCAKKLKGVVYVLMMPALSPSMARGTVTQLYSTAPGSVVSKYSLFADIKCKSLMKAAAPEEEVELEIELQDDVVVARVLTAVGEIVNIGAPLAVFCEEEEDVELAAAIDVSTADSLNTALGNANIRAAVWQAYVKSEKHSISCG